MALAPLAITRTNVVTRLPLPYFGTFLETNIRLYSIDDAGRHGVLFRSLETSPLSGCTAHSDWHRHPLHVGADANEQIR